MSFSRRGSRSLLSAPSRIVSIYSSVERKTPRICMYIHAFLMPILRSANVRDPCWRDKAGHNREPATCLCPASRMRLQSHGTPGSSVRSSLATRPGRFSLAPLDRPSGLRRLFFPLFLSLCLSFSFSFTIFSSLFRRDCRSAVADT